MICFVEKIRTVKILPAHIQLAPLDHHHDDDDDDDDGKKHTRRVFEVVRR